MARRRSWRCAVLVAAVCTLGAGTGANKRLVLHPGDSQLLEIGRAVELTVSRRGVIDVNPLTTGIFEMTALRRGLVIVEARDPDTGEIVPPRYVVAVTDQTDADADAAINLDAAMIPPPTAAEMATLKLAIAARLGEGIIASVSAKGDVTVETLCAPLSLGVRRAHITALLAAEAPAAAIHLVCSEHRTGKAYRLIAKVIATSEADVNESGFRTKTWQSTPELALAAATHAGELIGAPEVLLATGDTVEVSSGGEFQVSPHVVRQDQSAAELTQWRRQGLSLKVGLLQAVAALRLQFEFSLRARPSAGNAAQAAHALSGALPITVDQPLLAGTIAVQSTGRERVWQQGLASIPIIGPLWRFTTADTGKTKLALWLTLRNSD